MAESSQARFGLTVAVHPELARLVKSLARRRRQRHGATADGAQYSPELERVLMWLCELTDGDVDKIMEEGAAGVERFRALPPDYEPTTWDGERPLRRRSDSVFGPGSAVPGRTVVERPVASRRRPGGAEGDTHQGARQAHGDRRRSSVH